MISPRPRNRTHARLLAGIFVPVMVVSGCTDRGERDAAATSPAELVVVASDIAFDSAGYTVAAGDVAVTLEQAGFLPHTLVIEDQDGQELDFLLMVGTDASEDTATIELAPGTYVLFCEIAGHRAAGQEATLTVE
ncbi:MAG: hypothetical protein AAF531_25925 [Actinomycetota bacterium]